MKKVRAGLLCSLLKITIGGWPKQMPDLLLKTNSTRKEGISYLENREIKLGQWKDALTVRVDETNTQSESSKSDLVSSFASSWPHVSHNFRVSGPAIVIPQLPFKERCRTALC